jgi:hypothetical protein
MSWPVNRLTLIRRIRAGNLEAVVAKTDAAAGSVRYGVFFRRVPEPKDGIDNVLFEYSELLTVAKLARMAHASLLDMLWDTDPK